MKRIYLYFAPIVILVGCGGREEGTAPSATGTRTTSTQSAAERTRPAEPTIPTEQLIAQGDAAVRNREPNTAVRLYSKAIAQDPANLEALLKRASLLAENRQLSQAIVDMTTAIGLRPERSRLRNTRGYFYLLNQQFERAEQDFNDAIGMDLTYPQPYNNRGLIWLARRRFEEALRDFDNAIRVKSDYTDAHNNRGFALLQLERDQEAVESFSRALELDEYYINALTNRARAYGRLNKPTLAVQDLTRAIEIQPENLQLRTLRGEAYQAAGQLQEAAADWNHVSWVKTLSSLNSRLERNPRSPDLWTSRGEHLLSANQPEEALQSFEKALKLESRHPGALLGRATIHMAQKDYARVVEDCSTILEKQPALHEVRSLRGEALAAQGHFDEAIRDYEACRRFDSQVVAAYLGRAEQKRARGEEKQAQQDEAYAESLRTQLSAAQKPVKQIPPRAMVIEQASYEEPADDAGKN